MNRSVMMAFAAAASILPAAARGQDANLRHGGEIAQSICVVCHAVTTDALASPNVAAPPFARLARTEGMTSIALTAALQTSHRQMPNLILQADEQHDVIAYILSLK